MLGRLLTICSFLTVVLIVGGASAQEKSWFAALKIESGFLQADLEGSWAVHQVSIAGGKTSWEFGELEIAADGTVAGGSTSGSTGRSRTFSDGRLSLNPSGQIRGDFRVSEGSLDLAFTIEEGQLQGKRSGGTTTLKDIAILAAACAECTPNQSALLLLTRRQGTFATADLFGGWRIYNLRFENDTNELTWEFGPVNLLDNGTLNADDLLNNFLQDPFGNQRQITEASLTVLSDDGEVAGTLKAGRNDERVDSFTDGILSPDKNRITAVLESDDSERLLSIWIKTSGSVVFSTAQDLVGFWRLFGLGFESPPGEVFVSFGDLNVETPSGSGPAASITGGSLANADTKAVVIVGDDLSLNDIGRLRGTIASRSDKIVIESDPRNTVREDGRMDLQKVSLTFVGDGFIVGEAREPDTPDEEPAESCFISVAGGQR